MAALPAGARGGEGAAGVLARQLPWIRPGIAGPTSSNDSSTRFLRPKPVHNQSSHMQEPLMNEVPRPETADMERIRPDDPEQLRRWSNVA